MDFHLTLHLQGLRISTVLTDSVRIAAAIDLYGKVHTRFILHKIQTTVDLQVKLIRMFLSLSIFITGTHCASADTLGSGHKGITVIHHMHSATYGDYTIEWRADKPGHCLFLWPEIRLLLAMPEPYDWTGIQMWNGRHPQSLFPQWLHGLPIRWQRSLCYS